MPLNDTPTLDAPSPKMYNLRNNAVRSRQAGMLIEKDGPGWKPPQQNPLPKSHGFSAEEIESRVEQHGRSRYRPA
jgi:hypothetical protein